MDKVLYTVAVGEKECFCFDPDDVYHNEPQYFCIYGDEELVKFIQQMVIHHKKYLMIYQGDINPCPTSNGSN